MDLVLERVARLLTVDASGMSPVDLVKADLVDPVRLFVKNELHSAAKVAQGRFRLIGSVSIIDQLVERFYAQDQNDAEIEVWNDIPSSAGMGHDDENLALMIDKLSNLRDPVSSDISGFDWSVTQWLLDLDAERRALLGGVRVGKLARARAFTLGRSVFVLSDGRAFTLRTPGVMKSGSYLTASTNSFIRWALALLVGSSRAVTMGDDCVEDTESDLLDLVAEYASWGFRVTDARRCSLDTGIEMCSVMVYSEVERCEFLGWVKQVANMLRRKPANRADVEQQLRALDFTMRHNRIEDRVKALNALLHAGWGA